MSKKNYHVSLDEEYVEFFKRNCGLQLSKFLNDCIINYVDLIHNQDYDSLTMKLKRIDDDIKESKMTRKMVLQQMVSINKSDNRMVENPQIYESFVENRGLYKSDDYEELFQATGLRKSQLQRLTEYFIKYDKEDYLSFKNLDYAIEKFNEDHPTEMPLCRDGGYL